MMECKRCFHEFGMDCTILLTRVDYRGVAGINGVAWDAVELPSQFRGKLVLGATGAGFDLRTYRVGERIPAALYQKCGGKEFSIQADGAAARVQSVRFPYSPEYEPEHGGRV